ncbi:MAG: apolipoprotein N-acyltransferase [Lentisphaerae bacterium]|nr:apolipoprotein N-acyltransferase [Lentisphaerota bacterium]
MNRNLSLPAALLSGLLLWVAFPPVAQADAAWFALVPLLLALRRATPRRGFRLAWLAGMAFWLGNLIWLWRLVDNGGPLLLVVFGHAALAAYCALYAGAFGLASAWLWRHPVMDRSPWVRLLMVIVVAPLLWVGTEQVRGTLLTGFAWNALGVSQFRNLALIQCASWGGMSAVSALLVAVNGGIALLLERTWIDLVVRRRLHPAGAPPPSLPRGFPLRTVELSLALLLCIVCWYQGIDRVRAIDRRCAAAPRWRLALFHPEAPSFFERGGEGALGATLARLVDHAEIAGAARPDLCIWPETMLPGPPPYDAPTRELVRNATARTGAPLLAGGLEIEPGPGWDWTVGARYYNSAFLFDAAGEPTAVYRKQHLVPFGEYIPGDRWLPWLGRLSPIGYSCSPGRVSSILEVGSRQDPARPPLRLSPLICFEDTLPYLARHAARAGADLLVNLTNDAWFDGSSEAEQHLAQAVFRCVETGLPMVRSSNSGVTAVILPNGRVTRRLGRGDGAGEPGLLVDETGIDAQPMSTPFQRVGPAFLGFPGTLLLFIIIRLFFHEEHRGRRPAMAGGKHD